jgi:hypothetical protein
MLRHRHLHCRRRCRCASKQWTANNSKAPSSPPPPPLSLRKRSMDHQQCQGTFICTAATAVVAQRSNGMPTIPRHHHPHLLQPPLLRKQAREGQPTMPRHCHLSHHHHRCCCMSKCRMANYAKALLSAPPPLLSSFHEQTTGSIANNAKVLSSPTPPLPPPLCEQAWEGLLTMSRHHQVSANLVAAI